LSSDINYNAQGYEASHTIDGFKKILKNRNEKGYKLIDLATGW